VHFYRYYVSQSSEFCRHNPLCCFSTSVYCCLFHYRLSPVTFGYTLVCMYVLWEGLGIFLFTTASRPALGPTQPPIQWKLGALSLDIRQQVVKPTTHFHLVLRSVMRGVSSLFPNTPSWSSAQLKHRDNFIFICYVCMRLHY
jgi:hypothetical protein